MTAGTFTFRARRVPAPLPRRPTRCPWSQPRCQSLLTYCLRRRRRRCVRPANSASAASSRPFAPPTKPSTTSTASFCNPIGKRNPTRRLLTLFTPLGENHDSRRAATPDSQRPAHGRHDRHARPRRASCENQRRLLPLPPSTLRRNARHHQPTQQPSPSLLLQEKAIVMPRSLTGLDPI